MRAAPPARPTCREEPIRILSLRGDPRGRELWPHSPGQNAVYCNAAGRLGLPSWPVGSITSARRFACLLAAGVPTQPVRRPRAAHSEDRMNGIAGAEHEHREADKDRLIAE